MTKIHIILLFVFGLLILSQCKKDSNSCHEEINPACICTHQYEPVYGCNVVSYGNACEAERNGITVYTLGDC